MNRMTKMYRDKRWLKWLVYFLAGVFIAKELAIVYWLASHDKEISDLQINKLTKKQVEVMLDVGGEK